MALWVRALALLPEDPGALVAPVGDLMPPSDFHGHQALEWYTVT